MNVRCTASNGWCSSYHNPIAPRRPAGVSTGTTAQAPHMRSCSTLAAPRSADRLVVGERGLTRLCNSGEHGNAWRRRIAARGDEACWFAVGEPESCVVGADAVGGVEKQPIQHLLPVGGAGDECTDAFEPFREVESTSIVDGCADQERQLLEGSAVIVVPAAAWGGRGA